jgi:hypothetical protein
VEDLCDPIVLIIVQGNGNVLAFPILNPIITRLAVWAYMFKDEQASQTKFDFGDSFNNCSDGGTYYFHTLIVGRISGGL